MAAPLIPIDLFALDQFDLPARRAGVGLAAALAEVPPVLRLGAQENRMWLAEGTDGMTLGAPLAQSGIDQAQGVRVTVEALPSLAAFLLVRIGGTPVGLAARGNSTGADNPELLAAFAAGTLIDTPDGARPVETLVAGDRVTTIANGSPLVTRKPMPGSASIRIGISMHVLATDLKIGTRKLYPAVRSAATWKTTAARSCQIPSAGSGGATRHPVSKLRAKTPRGKVRKEDSQNRLS